MKTMIITTIFSVLGMLCISCSDLSSINSDIADLDKRISVLEESITAVNDNAVAVKALMDKSIIILDYTKQEYGWTLVLNDGTALKVTDGISAPVLVPIIGVDRNGRWIMSTDAGKTFSTIANSTASDAGDGRTPQISTDDSGYWIISFDGTSWNRILDSEGNPINARDGREVAGGYAFFSSVTFDQENENMQFHLITGEQLTVPVLKNGGIYVEGYADKDIVFPGRKMEYKSRLADVAGAVWKEIPAGWDARLTDSSLSFTVPEDAAPGDYRFTLVTTSSKGIAKVHRFTLTCSSYIFEDDFSKDGIPDERYWSLCPRRYATGWSSLMSESYDQAYVKDGCLVLVAEKDPEKGYLSGGIKTQDKVWFKNCRIEIRTRFTKMSQGVVSAAWLFPQTIKWPDGGEIDIYEHLNSRNNVWQTCHSYYTHILGYDEDIKHKQSDILAGQFNTYAIDITEEAVIFYINGAETFRYANQHLADEEEKMQYPFGTADYYLLLDNCLGMDWPGEPDDDQLPSRIEIDWVRISKL